uniref:NADH-ubiquinone oxidoreductase chain 6 n=1 Tax=Coleoptera sp. 12 KM-2017 TaxID=2219315 RepID=A0A346RGH9_9COLE|nr:NADH dehydrogenase subunit 6 [Coleoptera sp. 12 KM-2017]
MLNLSLILIMNSLILIFLNHPLTLGLILLMQTIITALMIGFMNLNYWFSYILFLVMIGGMLILFIYMTSIASNEKFKFSFNLFILTLTIPMSQLLLFFTDFYIHSFKINSIECLNFNSPISFILTMIKIFKYPMMSNLIMIIIYLLITLIMVVKITDFQNGPLRQKK